MFKDIDEVRFGFRFYRKVLMWQGGSKRKELLKGSNPILGMTFWLGVNVEKSPLLITVHHGRYFRSNFVEDHLKVFSFGGLPLGRGVPSEWSLLSKWTVKPLSVKKEWIVR